MPGAYSPDVIELAKLLMAAHGINSMAALDAAQAMVHPTMPHEAPVQAPVAPVPLNAHLATPEHLEDANISAWQRYSQMLDANPQPKDAAAGAGMGRRTGKVLK